ncbi:hypothetical protein HZA38_02795 [Candidatus Peregrinibacteria bacterium]|nr:hypothetical protein [Candidatus Peregrinibacteria bacterium]
MKKEYPDVLLFFRLGDFYEMFGDDAKKASQILEITLTARHKDSENPIPMCGVPHHSAENYIAKLLKAGEKVAIAEQVSDQSLPGILERKVVRVITPGTTFSEQILEAREHQFIAAVCEENFNFALSIADLSTGDFFVREISGFEEVRREIMKLEAREIILPPELFSEEDFMRNFPVISRQIPQKNPKEHLERHFQTRNLKGFGLEDKELCRGAASLLLTFLEETQKSSVPHLKNIRLIHSGDFLPLDPETIKHLELFYDAEGKKEGSLVSLLDETETAMGGRKLRQTMLSPLKDRTHIEERLDAVEELSKHPEILEDLEKSLKNVADLERLIAKISCGRGNPRDLLALKNSLQKLPDLKRILAGVHGKKLQKILSFLEEN